jgi:hypothetical protein
MKKLTITTLFLAVLLCSCSHYYYVTNVQNVPLFKEKNEFRFTGAYGEGDESGSIEAQASYSVTDHIGVMADFMSVKGGDVSGRNYGKGNYFEGAIGYYRPTGESGVFEIYGGAGGSSQHHEYSNSDNSEYRGSAEVSFLKLFVQPSFGITLDFCDVAFSTRIGSLSYFNIENKITGDVGEYQDLYTVTEKNHFILEPAITLRGGWKNIKAQFQVGYAGIVNKPELLFAEEWHVSFGLSIAFAKKYRQNVPNTQKVTAKIIKENSVQHQQKDLLRS